MFFVNLATRSLVVLAGLFIALGISPFDSAPSPFREIFGIVVVLFGVYRLITYTMAVKRQER